MRLFIIACVTALAAFTASAQVPDPNNQNLVRIAYDTTQINRALEELNKRLAAFSSTFNSNQGLRLSDRQQRILFIFELLNRSESRLSNLQMLKVQLVERSLSVKRRLAQIEDDLREESIERSVTGSFNAEQVRKDRRRKLEEQRTEIEQLLIEIENSVRDYGREIVALERNIERLRGFVFPEIENELNGNDK